MGNLQIIKDRGEGLREKKRETDRQEQVFKILEPDLLQNAVTTRQFGPGGEGWGSVRWEGKDVFGAGLATRIILMNIIVLKNSGLSY